MYFSLISTAKLVHISENTQYTRYLIFYFSELNVKELDEKVCDESSCKYGGVCKEEGESWKCVCQLQVRIFHINKWT